MDEKVMDMIIGITDIWQNYLHLLAKNGKELTDAEREALSIFLIAASDRIKVELTP